MKKILIATFSLLLTLIFVNSALAGSVTITSQVLDSSVRPGGQTTVFLTFTNPSTTTVSSNVRIYITPGPYVKPYTTYMELGTLDTGSSQQTSFPVNIDSSAVSMTSYLTVKAKYYSGSIEEATTVNVPITIRRVPTIQITNVEYTPSLIEPGNTVTLNFDLMNDGDGTAKDVKAVITQTSKTFIVKGSPEIFIEEIKSKESGNVAFTLTIDPSLTIGTYSIPISLSYYDETKSQNYSVAKSIGLAVSGKYNFVVTGSQDIVAPGMKSNIDIQVANAGSQEALYLTVKILPSSPIIQVIPQFVYMGNLESDDYSVESFEFKISSDASTGTYPLNVQLTYKDPYGGNYTDEYQVDVVVSSVAEFAESKKGSTPIFSIVISVVAIVAIAYFLYRKFKKKK